jgi:2-octaprenyl-6-methoxyphenol hydroxylase
MMQFEIAVVGGGLAGSIAALSLARAGRSVALVAGPAARADGRTTALMDQSIRFLERLGLWEKIAPATAALSTMQIIDGTNRLLRAPTVKFRSSEVGLAAFGYNMPNASLIGVLDEAIALESRITRFEQFATDITLGADRVTIVLADSQALEAGFVVGADGRKSKVRDSAGIEIRNWSYPQTALVMNFVHSIPHADVSTEFHTESGPFTQVPLPGDRSSLVWVVKPDEAERMAALPLEELGRLVEQRMQSMLGRVTVEVAPQAWPLSGMMATRFGKGRAALVGEAAHAFPPIGAQGLNLSLRDVMTLTDIVGENPELPVTADAGDRFDRRRRPDIVSRSTSVDLLNRSLLSDYLPVQVLRAAGLQLLSAVAPLRNLVMREGIEPGRGLRSLPELLREKIRR